MHPGRLLLAVAVTVLALAAGVLLSKFWLFLLSTVALVAVGLWVAREYLLPPPVGTDP